MKEIKERYLEISMKEYIDKLTEESNGLKTFKGFRLYTVDEKSEKEFDEKYNSKEMVEMFESLKTFNPDYIKLVKSVTTTEDKSVYGAIYLVIASDKTNKEIK